MLHPMPIVAVSSYSPLPPEKVQELEGTGYIVVEVLTVDDIKVLNGREVEKILPQLSRWQRFLSVFR